jgi:hypothetical protein
VKKRGAGGQLDGGVVEKGLDGSGATVGTASIMQNSTLASLKGAFLHTLSVRAGIWADISPDTRTVAGGQIFFLNNAGNNAI